MIEVQSIYSTLNVSVWLGSYFYIHVPGSRIVTYSTSQSFSQHRLSRVGSQEQYEDISDIRYQKKYVNLWLSLSWITA